MKKKFYFIFKISVLYLLISSCSVDKSKQKNGVNLDEIAKKVEVVEINPLEKGQLISSINKLKVLNGTYFIHALKDQFLLQAFDGTNKLLFSSTNSYDSIGRVVFVNDFEVSGNKLYILDSQKKSLFIYDINKDFLLLGQINIPFYASKIAVHKQELLLYKNEQAFNFEPKIYFYNILKLDSLGNLIHGLEPFYINDGSRKVTSITNPFYTFKDETYYLKPFNDTIFYFTNDNYKPYYIAENNKTRYTFSDYNDGKMISEYQITSPLHLVKNDKYMGYWFASGNDMNFKLLNSKSLEVIVNTSSLYYKEFGRIPFPLSSSEDGFLYSIIDENSMINFNLFESLDKEIVRKVSEDGKIFIFKYKI